MAMFGRGGGLLGRLIGDMVVASFADSFGGFDHRSIAISRGAKHDFSGELREALLIHNAVFTERPKQLDAILLQLRILVSEKTSKRC